MIHTTHSLMRLVDERMNELRSRAATQAVVNAMIAEKRRVRREAALAAIKEAIRAKEERAAHAWQSQQQAFNTGRLRGAR